MTRSSLPYSVIEDFHVSEKNKNSSDSPFLIQQSASSFLLSSPCQSFREDGGGVHTADTADTGNTINTTDTDGQCGERHGQQHRPGAEHTTRHFINLPSIPYENVCNRISYFYYCTQY